MSKTGIISININGDDNKGFREKRKEGVAKVLLDHMPHLAFVQDCPWEDLQEMDVSKFDELGHYKFSVNAERTKATGNKLYNGLIFDKARVTCTNCNDRTVKEIYETLQGNGNWSEKFILCRLALFKVKLLTNEILCASWHGPNTSEKGDIKIDHLKSMLAFLLEVKNCEKCPLIIGGDFNLTAEKVEDHLNSKFKPKKPSKSSKDMILFTPDVEDIFNISVVKPLPLYKSYKFDHAPLKIEVTLKTTEEKDGERAEAVGGEENERDVQKRREDEGKTRTERRKKEEEGKKKEDDDLSPKFKDMKIKDDSSENSTN